MLTRVEIENYRGFRSFQMDGLATVNLIVGKNNSGKTALLEAVHFIASGGNPTVLIDVANRRSEYMVGEDYGGPTNLIDTSHFFHGHEINVGSAFSVTSSNGLPSIHVKAVSSNELDDDLLFEGRDYAYRPGRQPPEWLDGPVLAMQIEVDGSSANEGRTFLLSEAGALLFDPRRPRHLRRWIDEKELSRRIVYISPDASKTESLAKMWDLVLRDKREDEVRKAMQILEPELQDVVFQASEGASRYRSSTGILIGFKDNQRRVPLGSMGDGMRRLLGLSLSLLHAKSGFLLIDEIDTGLHYSIMAKMWELVVRTAAISNTQVFATTHSADCVRGLGFLCGQSPELQEHIAVHKIERELEKSVLFSGEDVLNAVEQDIEIR